MITNSELNSKVDILSQSLQGVRNSQDCLSIKLDLANFNIDDMFTELRASILIRAEMGIEEAIEVGTVSSSVVEQEVIEQIFPSLQQTIEVVTIPSVPLQHESSEPSMEQVALSAANKKPIDVQMVAPLPCHRLLSRFLTTAKWINEDS